MIKKIKITDCIQNFMFYKLIFVPQYFFIEDEKIFNLNGVIHTAAAHETECAGAADFLYKRSRGKINTRDLRRILKNRMIEIDNERHLKTFQRFKADPLIAFFDMNLFLNADKMLGRGLLLNTGGLNQKHKRAGAAVHNRNLRGSEIHIGIINT